MQPEVIASATVLAVSAAMVVCRTAWFVFMRWENDNIHTT